jgi:hypothetical protein
MPEPTERRRKTSPVRLLFTAIAAASLATLTVLVFRAPSHAPRATWVVDGRSETEQFARVQADTPVSLQLELQHPAFVYAVRHDTIGGWIALHPSSTLRSDTARTDAFPRGRHALPGAAVGDRTEPLALAWPTGQTVGAVSFFVVVSDRRLEDLEQALARCEQMGNAAFPNRSLLAPYAPETGLENTPDPATPPHRLFAEAMRFGTWASTHRLEPSASTPGVFVGAFRLQHAIDPEALSMEPNELEARIRERIEELLADTPTEVLAPGETGPPATAPK